MARKVNQRTLEHLKVRDAPVEPPPPRPEQFARAETEPSAALLLHHLRGNDNPNDLLNKADALEVWGRVIAVLSFLAAAVWFVGGVGLVKNGIDTGAGDILFGVTGIGALAVFTSIGLVVSGFWWAALHNAAAAHLRSAHALVSETQKQNAILTELQERLAKE